ncbi:hypothetical protein ACROYT_G004902 [Oculina patagonica]
MKMQEHPYQLKKESAWNPINSISEAIYITNHYAGLAKTLAEALVASGFRRVTRWHVNNAAFLPCPLGTFANVSTKGADGCIECPPGGFYSDDVGFIGTGCKECPNGSFVSFDKAPGTNKQDCKSCPEGTETDFFAGYRACKCLEGSYRTHMFEKCHKCGQSGLKCQDDYASLKPGYWWEWRNVTYTARYRDYIANLLKSSPSLDISSVQIPFSIPTPHKCPREDSCKGGLDSSCKSGYEGPLCAVCSPGYFKQLQICSVCPSKKWIFGQLSIIVVIVLIIVLVMVWTGKKRNNKGRKRPLVDMLLSKVKIVIGFYQVTYGLLETFSYIKWPGSLQGIAKYSETLQMDVLHIAPFHCLSSNFRADAFGRLFVMMVINVAVISLSVVFYGVRKVIILRSQNLQDNEKSRKISYTKELVFGNLLFSWIKPIRDVTENRLMATSLAVTVVNLGIGAVSRIPAENISASKDTYKDDVAFKILVFGANTLVIGLLVSGVEAE